MMELMYLNFVLKRYWKRWKMVFENVWELCV